MEIEIANSPELNHYDGGGGCREVKAKIEIAEGLSPRMKRKTALYETLGCVMGYIIPHEQIDDISDILLNVLDQLEPL